MLVIVGYIVVVGSVLGGFTMAGGSIGSLIHPSELVTIGGAALGALITMCPMKVLMDLIKAVLAAFKGNQFGKVAYEELFKAMYELMQNARRNGLLFLEQHVREPEQSSIFSKYPTLVHNHHAMEFIAGSLSLVIDGTVTPEQLPELMEAELKTLEDEHHAPLDVITKTADGLPGFGIVAAVLGIVVTMAHIDGPVEEIGHSVGAALVGTFLGILMSYGFIAPLAVQMDFLGKSEFAYFRSIATILQGMANNTHPKVVIEKARRSMPGDARVSQEELAEMLAGVQ